MVVTDEVEEHFVPPFTEVVGMRIVVHSGVMHVPHVKGKHWWNITQPYRDRCISGCDSWLLDLSEGTTDIRTIEAYEQLLDFGWILWHDSFKVCHTLPNIIYWQKGKSINHATSTR